METTKQSTAVNPMMALTLAMIYWAQEVQKDIQSAHYPIDTVKRMTFLRKVGLTNTANAKEIKEYASKVELFQFMRKMWQDLGENTLLVKFSDFHKILCDYNLMCGDFLRYNGEIPEKNVQEIENAIELYESGLMGNYALPIEYTKYLFLRDISNNGMVLTPKISIDGVRLPISIQGIETPVFDVNSKNGTKITNHYSRETFKDYPFFIAAPRSKMRGFNFTYQRRTWNYREAITCDIPLDFDEAGFSFARDPFVCSICEHGVIIHSMWGAEAEDATIKRYEQMRDAIIGKPKMLTV